MLADETDNGNGSKLLAPLLLVLAAVGGLAAVVLPMQGSIATVSESNKATRDTAEARHNEYHDWHTADREDIVRLQEQVRQLMERKATP